VWAFLDVMFRMKQHFTETAGEFDLSPQQAVALQQLDAPRSMGELAECMSFHASNVTGLVDRLEERGLVERQVDPNDRRIKILVLTDAGRDLRQAHVDRLYLDVPLKTMLSPTDRRALRNLLRKVVPENPQTEPR